MTIGLVIAGKYRLLNKLGQGGMGAVWRAEHLTLGTQVAIKLIDVSIAESEQMLARFRREAQSAAELRSTHVVHIMDYGVDNGTPYIAMELLDGESLAQRLERTKRIPPVELADVLSQVGRALTRAHQGNIVHRDLKPDNIFLVRDGDEEIAKVLDFGIAKKLGLSSAGTGLKTQTGAMLGTPYYMSPEQAKGQGTVDHRTDIWSLAIIAYECLTGVRPFNGDSLTSLLISICTGTVAAPSSVADVPTGFDAWFARATDRNPEQRFQTVAEATAELRRVLWYDARARERDGSASAGIVDSARANADFERTVEPSALTIGTIPKKSNRVAVLIGVGVAALIGVGVVGARFLFSPDSDASPEPLEAREAAPVNAQTVVAPLVPSAVAAASVLASAVAAADEATPTAITTSGAPIAALPSARRPAHKAVVTPATGHSQVAPTPSATTVLPAAPAGSSQPAKHNYYKSVGF